MASAREGSLLSPLKANFVGKKITVLNPIRFTV